MKKINKILRFYLVPLAATAVALGFWIYYRCAAPNWFLVLIGIIFFIHYFFYFRRREEE